VKIRVRNAEHRFNRSLLFIIFASFTFAFLRGVIFKRLETDDEGVNGIMALNMCHSQRFLTWPSYIPGGLADWSKEDLPAIANTPFHSALLALGGCALGIEGMGLVSFLSLVATVVFLYRLVALWDRRAALLGATLFVVSPIILWQFRLLELEMVMSAWGLAGTYWIARGELSEKKWLSLLGGACLGFGFLSKLWLVTPFVLASAGLIVAIRIRARVLRVAPVALVIVGFLSVSSLHLAYVALRSPADVSLWLRGVYFSVMIGESIGGHKMSAAGVYPEWVHPFWYYPAILYREHFFTIPILIAGFPSLLKRAKSMVELLAVIAAGLLTLIPLSIPPIKEPLYILATLPFFYALVGLSITALLARIEASEDLSGPLDRWAQRGSGAVSALLTLAIVGAYVKGIKRDDITLAYTFAHACGMFGAWLLMSSAPRLDRTRWTFVATGLFALGLASFVAFDLTHPVPPYKEIAEILRPYLESQPPERESFISPKYKIILLYLFRNGRYYKELRPEMIPANLASGSLCAVVMGPDERKSAEGPGVERALEGSAIDLRSKLPSRYQGSYRIFVSPACQRAPSMKL
jgi:hypothetical protein